MFDIIVLSLVGLMLLVLVIESYKIEKKLSNSFSESIKSISELKEALNNLIKESNNLQQLIN